VGRGPFSRPTFETALHQKTHRVSLLSQGFILIEIEQNSSLGISELNSELIYPEIPIYETEFRELKDDSKIAYQYEIFTTMKGKMSRQENTP
jgi:hypothetical protein